jgi:serine/threonine protein kinase
MSSLEGQTLGQYRVIAQMGQGGMATVYKAYHPRLDRFVAIKMMHQAFLEDKNFLARFEREAQIVARLDHPHIVPVFDFADFEGRPYLVMKYVEGRTLKGVLEDRPLALSDILNIMPPIADALDYAHRQGVLHRDIKPSNIIIDVNGTPYLTDFGLARMAQLGESTLSHDMLLGTPHYISPEQAMGSRELDNRTDLYSLGVVLYELVVGRVPFSADTPFAIIHDHIYRPLPEPAKVNPEITPEVSAVLQKALAKSPADRYETAAEMVAAFASAVEASNMLILSPERVSIAEESLAELRRSEDHATELLSNVGKPKRAFAPPVPPPSVPAPQPPPNPETHVVIEKTLDFGEVSKFIGQAGEAIQDAFESWNTKNIDYELAPYEDEEVLRKRIEAQFKKRGEFVGHVIAYVLVNALLWIIFSGTGGLSFLGDDPHLLQWLAFPWPMIVSLGWGAGLVAHFFDTYFQTGSRDERRYRAIRSELHRLYGNNWRGVDRRELKKVRRRVERPFKKRSEFFQHIGVYILINAMLWMIYLFGGNLPDVGEAVQVFPWPALVTLGWGIGVVADFIETVGAAGRERAIQRAIEREYGEKRKNSDEVSESSAAREIRLTADGELTDSMAVEWEDEDKPKRSESRRRSR